MRRNSIHVLGLFLVLVCAIILASGCTRKPTQEIADAEAALNAAKDATASEHATEKYKSAEDALNQARAKLEEKEYKEAKELALSAKKLADEAKESAIQEAMRLKGLKEDEIRKLREAGLSEKDIAGTGALGEGVSITKLENVYFDFDKSNIRDDARAILEKNSQWLKDNSNVKIQIEGHCDERGTEEYNLALGQRRADSTKSYLETLGIDTARLSTISYGEERPAEQGHGESAWSKNRRSVSVVISE